MSLFRRQRRGKRVRSNIFLWHSCGAAVTINRDCAQLSHHCGNCGQRIEL